ncbi:MAG: hypothetical protein COA79_24735 [Planctomycetota bacterium]|nr:MAG: hypothetical protein COA79_24735 [Planctomycetota bacterium]
MKLGVRAILLGWFLTIVFIIITLTLEMVIKNTFTVTDTLIPVLTYFFIIVVVLLINPLFKMIYSGIKFALFKPFNRHEILLIAMMTLLTSGIPSYGLMSYLLPFLGAVNNPTRATNATDWGLLSETAVWWKEDGIKQYAYGENIKEDENHIWLKKLIRVKGKLQSEVNKYDKNKVGLTIQRPLINPNLVLNREDSMTFEQGLEGKKIIDKSGKVFSYPQNSFPALLPKPKENFKEYRARLTSYYDNRKLEPGYTFWGNVPWVTVGKPFLFWMILILSIYMVLFSLARILFTQWSKYERLQFPLAMIPQAILGEPIGNDEEKKYPSFTIWKNSFFIMGLVTALSFILLAGFDILELKLEIKNYVVDTVLEGIGDFNLTLHVFFILIGIAFIVPKEISFSVWFFSLIVIAELLLAVWFGYGKTAGSFKSDYYLKLPFYSAQAFGGLIVFSSFMLWNVRHYLFSAVYKILNIRPNKVSEEVISENYLASGLFIVSGIGVFSFMLWMNISFLWAVIYCFITLMFIVAAMRVASECGIIGFQNISASGSHFVRNALGIGNVGVASLVNIFILQVIFFFDTKTFLAPNVMVAQKVEDEAQIEKRKFWITLFIAVIIAVAISFIFMSMLIYHDGSKSLETWYFKDVPKQVYDSSVRMLKSSAGEPMLEVNKDMILFLGFGAFTMIALLFARTKWFWVPHPVGIILWISPGETRNFVFCFFLGWVIKFVVTKFGTKDIIENMKKWAIGLIFGHILAIIILGLLITFTEITIHIKPTLNFF